MSKHCYRSSLIRVCTVCWTHTCRCLRKFQILDLSCLMTKPNKMACAPSEDSDQPGHPPSLIRVFAICMKKAWILSYPLRAQRRLIRLGGCPGWSESSLGAQPFCWFYHEVAHFRIFTVISSSVPVYRVFMVHVFVIFRRGERTQNITRRGFFNSPTVDWYLQI